MKIKVIMGGISSERAVSIHTGDGIVAALIGNYDVEGIILSEDFRADLSGLSDTDLIFNALHGGYGENGEIQSFFEESGFTYTGSGPEASRLAMNKDRTKQIACDVNVQTAPWLVLHLDDMVDPRDLRFPCVVKPVEEGSTFGLTIVTDKDQLASAIAFSRRFSPHTMIEDFVPGKELTVAILGNRTLPIIEIIPESGLYDYQSKYTPGKSQYICPAELSETARKEIQKAAMIMYRALGCRHYVRVDFRLNGDSYYLLEVNTLPGMTGTSLLPKSAHAVGLGYKDLIEEIIKLATEGK